MSHSAEQQIVHSVTMLKMFSERLYKEQHAKKVVRDCLVLLHFAVWQEDSVLHLTARQVKFLGKLFFKEFHRIAVTRDEISGASENGFSANILGELKIFFAH